MLAIQQDAGGRAPAYMGEDGARLAAMAAWRVTQGVYRFDPEVYQALLGTSMRDRLPCEVLMYLPEWCVYMETPGIEWLGSPLYGVFAHLEWDRRTDTAELRLVMDSDEALTPMMLSLEHEQILSSVDAAIHHRGLAAVAADSLEPILSLLLYLCSTNADLGDVRPMPPQPVKTKRGPRRFPPNDATVVEVGYRLGGVIRAAQAPGERPEGGGTGQPPDPHIRKAHWHTYWMGPRDGDRTPDVRWMPPIPVNMRDQIPEWATVRRVE